MIGRLWGMVRWVSRWRNQHTLELVYWDGGRERFRDVVAVRRFKVGDVAVLWIIYNGGMAKRIVRHADVRWMQETITPKAWGRSGWTSPAL